MKITGRNINDVYMGCATWVATSNARVIFVVTAYTRPLSML